MRAFIILIPTFLCVLQENEVRQAGGGGETLRTRKPNIGERERESRELDHRKAGRWLGVVNWTVGMELTGGRGC